MGVVVIADHAPCSASTTQPLFLKSEGCDFSATSSREAHCLASVGVDVLQADSGIQHAGEDGVTDGEAPQHAGVTGLGVVMRQLADRTGRLHQRGFVVEVSQCQRRSPHQRAVARGAASEFVQRRRLSTCCLRGDAVSACSAEDRPRSARQHLWRVATTRATAERGHRAPFPRAGPPRWRRPQRWRWPSRCRRSTHRAPSRSSTAHHGDLEFRAAGRAELVGGTQGVTGCGAQQNADGPVKLCGCQCHRSSLLSPTDMWAPVEAVES